MGHLTSFSSSLRHRTCERRKEVKDIHGDRSGSFVVIFGTNLGVYFGELLLTGRTQ